MRTWRIPSPARHVGWFAIAAVSVLAGAARAETSVLDGVYDAAQAERGLAVYADTCAACHGEAMQGGNDSPPLADEGFGYVWDGRSVGELFDYTTSMMPVGAVGSVSEQKMADVIAAILQANGAPPGPEGADLPADPEALAAITFHRTQ